VTRTANVYVDYQQRATEFRVGDAVMPYGDDPSVSGRVLAVYPAIGMVDVQFANGSRRYPVEELQRIRQDAAPNEPLTTDSVPGGAGTVKVPGGPYTMENVKDAPAPAFMISPEETDYERSLRQHSMKRVAQAFVKKSIYWASKDRKYKVSRSETNTGELDCPKCRSASLGKGIYKRRDGASDRLFVCNGCLFMIKDSDLMWNEKGGQI
jgi:hypothetical protein